MSNLKIVEFPANVRPASGLANAPGRIDLVESRVPVGLQDAHIVLQVSRRMLPLAIGRVGEPHRGRRGVPGGTVIPNIRPHSPRLRSAQAEGYAGFGPIYETGRIREAACWAHVSRKFYDLQVAHKSPIAQEALERIGALYAIEKEIRGRPPDERREIRQARARPLLESLHAWLESCLPKLSQKSDTTAAVKYALGRWEALTRYAEDGSLEIDNNAAERALRAVALGRKNYLFAGSDKGGERAAVLYSLIGTAKLNGLDPESYLRDVLSRLPDHPINHIEELLPWNVVPFATAPPSDQ